MSLALSRLKKRPVAAASAKKPKKKADRFDGLTEEEVQRYTLEDILEPDLDLVFVGINPSLMAAYRGRYYAGPGNHFYKLLHESGLVPRFVSFEEDKKLLDHKIGLTNIVARATRSSADLKKSEIKEGSTVVRYKLEIFKPKIAIFNGKCIWEVFADKTGKSSFNFGLQRERLGETAIWVVPSSSARCAHFPRMTDKLHFYTALKKYLSFLRGEIDAVNESEFRFDGKCKQAIASTSIMWRRKNVSAFIHGGRVANRKTVCLDTSEENIATVKPGPELIVTEILGGNDEDREFSRREDVENHARGSDSNEASSVELEKTKMSSSEEKIMSRETKEEGNDSGLSSSPKIREKNLKRPRTNEEPPLRAFKRQDSDDSIDFMNLIKQRLSEKRDRFERMEKNVETSSKPVKRGKKLNFANLGLNSRKKIINATTDPSENIPEMKD